MLQSVTRCVIFIFRTFERNTITCYVAEIMVGICAQLTSTAHLIDSRRSPRSFCRADNYVRLSVPESFAKSRNPDETNGRAGHPSRSRRNSSFPLPLPSDVFVFLFDVDGNNEEHARAPKPTSHSREFVKPLLSQLLSRRNKS